MFLKHIYQNFHTAYWLGGPCGLAYIGSSIHLFQNSKLSLQSRIKEHISHADLHRLAKPHKCKQPVLNSAMGNNLELWYILPIMIVQITEKVSKS